MKPGNLCIQGAKSGGETKDEACVSASCCRQGVFHFPARIGCFRKGVTTNETKELGIFGISRTVGTVLQDPDGQFIGLTVAEDIAFALENDCVGEPALHERVRRASQLVSIEDHMAHAPNELSGGQKQRVSLAGVMVDEVELLLFDEPLANLDPATGKQAMELIDEIQRETGAAVIIIEHRLEDSRAFVRRFIAYEREVCRG